ncbi:MAG: TadE/TadG family type IV pilus assembly protein [Dehalococcoidia bacterium]
MTKRSNRKEKGQSMVEFALVLPLFLVVMFIIADFGVGFSRWLVITNAAREGARMGTVGAAAAEVQDRTAATSNGLLTVSDITVNYQDFNGNGYPADLGDAVVVSTEYDYDLITPLGRFLNIAFGGITLSSCSDMRLELKIDDADGLGGPGC